MQKTLVTASFAAFLAMGSSVFAADAYSGGSLKDAPVYSPEASWTGLYVGAGVGGGFVNHDLTATAFGGSAELNGIGGEGVIGTVEVGYDRQFGAFVGGVFFNYDFSDVSSTLRVGAASINADLDNMWSAGGRFGYLINPNTLAYVLGAYSEAEFSLPAGVKSPTFSGYSVGGGLETKLGGAWYLKGEYRFTRLDTQTLGSGGGFKVTDDVDVQQVRLVLSYKANLFGHDYTPLK